MRNYSTCLYVADTRRGSSRWITGAEKLGNRPTVWGFAAACLLSDSIDTGLNQYSHHSHRSMQLLRSGRHGHTVLYNVSMDCCSAFFIIVPLLYIKWLLWQDHIFLTNLLRWCLLAVTSIQIRNPQVSLFKNHELCLRSHPTINKLTTSLLQAHHITSARPSPLCHMSTRTTTKRAHKSNTWTLTAHPLPSPYSSLSSLEGEYCSGMVPWLPCAIIMCLYHVHEYHYCGLIRHCILLNKPVVLAMHVNSQGNKRTSIERGDAHSSD